MDPLLAAMTACLKTLQRRRVDAAFAGMAEDAYYRQQALLIAEDFSASDWEALGLAEISTAEAP